MENNIEEQKVPLTVKQLVIYLIAVVTVVSSSMFAYNSIKNGLEDNTKRINTLEVLVKSLQDEDRAKDAINQDLKNRISILETENKYRNK